MGKRSENRKAKSKKGNKILIIALIILILIAGVLLAVKILNKEEEQPQEPVEEEPVVEQEKVEIFSGNSRPIAVMIDNNVDAWPHSGIDKAYMVYEIIVEGGETRLMALFKGQDVDSIGPVRSARHYFLDYALENDAIYVHLGWSPQAETQISTLGVNNINGQVYDTGKARTDTSKFWRQSGKVAPHDAYTNTAKILEIAEEKGYSVTSSKESVLNYVVDEVELTDGITAEIISIPYSGTSNTIKYEYDTENKVYIRYSKGKKQVVEVSGEDITTKNIIITFAKNTTLSDGENKGRQDVTTVGTLDGYYITNGKAIKITCEKSSRTSQTVYKDLQGNEIEVNDGNTYVQICPIDANVTIE